MKDTGFSFAGDNSALVFKTSSFSTLQQSALHSGAFNSELASSVASGTFIMFLLLLFRESIVFSFLLLVAGILLFGLLFWVFRSFMFKEPHLEAYFTKTDRSVEILKNRLFYMQRLRFAFDQVESAVLKEIHHGFTNTDGIDVVEKIALDHNTVMTGFGKPDHIYTAALKMKDQREIVIFSSKNKEYADKVIERINQFLEVKDAETD
ncbi:MAG: hypothetical protein RBT37_03840 [Dissulfurispiraceae bacterium]|jgi:hypothetical protein|nr:hypothetical protein [Dissulfurispiraceae bacterium]